LKIFPFAFPQPVLLLLTGVFAGLKREEKKVRAVLLFALFDIKN